MSTYIIRDEAILSPVYYITYLYIAISVFPLCIHKDLSQRCKGVLWDLRINTGFTPIDKKIGKETKVTVYKTIFRPILIHVSERWC